MSDIISTSLIFLQNFLNTQNSNGNFVELANIATLNDGDEFLESSLSIIMSVVNIEEDKTMRNPNVYQASYKNDNIDKYNRFNNPTLHINIYILFSSYEKNKSNINKYAGTIDQLEKVISSFQRQNVFTEDDMIAPQTEKIVLEMVNLSMEGLNQMWSFLGSKYMPSVLYKMKVVSIQSDENNNSEMPINSFEIQNYDGVGEADSLLLENKFYTNDIIKEEIKKNTNN